MAFINDKDGDIVNFQGSRKYPVDFTNEALYSRSAAGAPGYFDVPTELNANYAQIVTSTSGNLMVELLNDSEGDADLLYFQAGENSFKVRKIWYVADNDFQSFSLLY